MNIFSSLYARVMQWAKHPHASWYLSGLSFAESSFFPIPPDVMLAPMSLAQPNRAFYFAFLTTLSSVLGGIAGYFIGHWAFAWIEPILLQTGHYAHYLQVKLWFDQWGGWAILIAGFSPIPYKIFTITAGVISMNPLLFILASILGRGGRFFLVAFLMRWGGEAMEKKLHEYIDRIGWSLVILVIIAALIYQYV